MKRKNHPESDARDPEKFNGGCLCGAIRYEAEKPEMTGYCHCRMCQKALGSPFGAAYIFLKENVRFTSGALTWYRSSEFVQRGFCGRCGSPVAYQRLDTDDFVIWTGSLDQPDRLPPQYHWWTESRISWGDVHPELNDGTHDFPSHKVAARADPGNQSIGGMYQKSPGSLRCLVFFKLADFRYMSRQPGWYPSRKTVRRGFHPECGSPTTCLPDTCLLDGVDFTTIRTGTLANPAGFEPTARWHPESKIPWPGIHPDLPGMGVVFEVAN